MDTFTAAFISGIIGIFIGAIIQYLFQLRLIKGQINLENKQKLYKELFHQLRDLDVNTKEINHLICNAQLFASDNVLDILQKIDTDKAVNTQILNDLIVTMRKELFLGNKRRKICIYLSKSNKKV